MNYGEAICVYCASSANIPRVYIDAAFRLGELITDAGRAVVCGAGRTGLMGALIDGAIDHHGETIGVIPQFMVDNGWHHKGLSQMVVTEDMHERKQTMARLSRAAIALPGGCGTLEELLEIITWRQLGLFSGNIVILNINGYYDPLLAMLRQAADQGFMKTDHCRLWRVAATVEEAVEMALSNENSEFSSKY